MNPRRRRLLTALLVAPAMSKAQGTAAGDASKPFFDANFGDLKTELADARTAGKKAILLVYEQEGCPSCTFMRQHILSRSDVQDLYHRHFTNFAVDIFGSLPLKDFNGAGTTEKALAGKAGIRATPTFAFHDLTGTEVVRITGAIRDAGEFKLLAEFVAGGFYKTRKFAEFRQQAPVKTGG